MTQKCLHVRNMPLGIIDFKREVISVLQLGSFIVFFCDVDVFWPSNQWTMTRGFHFLHSADCCICESECTIGRDV